MTKITKKSMSTAHLNYEITLIKGFTTLSKLFPNFPKHFIFDFAEFSSTTLFNFQ
jgi:hypothetical protein